jgi:purine-cytosine permease-like protein
MARSDRIEGNWGIDPVPERLRVLGMLDTGLLWGNLGVSLLVIVAGAALVPALSLPDALFAIVLGCAIGNTMLGVAGTSGADARVPGSVWQGTDIVVAITVSWAPLAADFALLVTETDSAAGAAPA